MSKPAGESSFVITCDGHDYNISDAFTLADSVVELDVGGTTEVVQLISKKPDGTFRIRYKGEDRGHWISSKLL